MPPDPAPDPAAFLADAKRRAEAVTMPFSPHRCCEMSQADVPPLIGALEKVLERHQAGRIVILGALCPEHEACRHFSITSLEGARIVACPDCAATVYDSCAGCGPQTRLDSCPDRAAISAGLLGEGLGDG